MMEGIDGYGQTPAAPAAGPVPVDRPAAFNPYIQSPRATGETSHQRSETQAGLTDATPFRSPDYEVHPNPATISHQVTAPRSSDHGTAVGGRVLGSERLFHGLSYSFELLKWLLIAVILGVLVHLFVATVFRISGESMLPNFADGQFILVDKLSYLFGGPMRGDVVVIRFPGDPENRKFIKRVIGLPGEKVEVVDSKVFVDDRQLQEPYLPRDLTTEPDIVKVMRGDEYFVMGDNRPNSNDSRFFGPVPVEDFIGKSQAILSGSAFGWIATPAF